MRLFTILFLFAAAPMLRAADGVPAESAPAVLVRMENFLVTPSTGPVTHAVLKNQFPCEFKGILRVKFPDGWKTTPAQHTVSLQPGETKKFAFAIEHGTDRESNVYPVKITIAGNGATIASAQTVVCASTPYFKPVIDGNLADWKDAIPVAFTTDGKQTIVRTYWSKKQFCLAVEVEEDQLTSLEAAAGGTGPDAVLVAVGPAEAAAPDGKPARYEFMLVSSTAAATGGKCLMRKADAPADAAAAVQAEECSAAKIAVRRTGKITSYEVAIPLSLMPELRPDAGREYRFGLLVQDAGGTGLRDLGDAMNLWPEHRRPHAWGNWPQIHWGSQPPTDGSVEFGFCSSIH